MRSTRATRWLLIAGWLLVACVLPCRAEPSPATRPAIPPDADKWTRRNIELIRAAVDQAPREAESTEIAAMALGFSLYVNPLILRDPYTAEVAQLVEKFSKSGEAPPEVERFLEVLRKPESERVQWMQEFREKKRL